MDNIPEYIRNILRFKSGPITAEEIQKQQALARLSLKPGSEEDAEYQTLTLLKHGKSRRDILQLLTLIGTDKRSKMEEKHLESLIIEVQDILNTETEVQNRAKLVDEEL